MARIARLLVILFCSVLCFAQEHRVKSLRIQILSTMLADDDGFGEWGFAALVDADGHKILFDTGAHPDTVSRNVRELKVDLSGVTDVILSHHHIDHTAGLMTLRREFPNLSKVHVARGIFLSRPGTRGEGNSMIAVKGEFERTGGTFVEYDYAREIYPGIWLTGPVPRKYPERNWSGRQELRTADGKLVEDNLPEDQSLVFDTDRGLVILSGCGHSGIINTMEYARAKVREAPIHAAIGGFHLFAASDSTLDWTAGKLKGFGLQNFLGAHCTGIEAVYRLRALTGLDRKTAAVGAVGGGFELGRGLTPGNISR
jgi:7,8-dihydropterin-6-yl-methyl-4-(beta-D-ribofuranosyl)aminobenzene 5'-phosphate synthase